MPANPGQNTRPDPEAGFLDAASGQPLNPGGQAALAAAFAGAWADPQRWYSDARRSRMILDAARQSVAEALTLRPPEVSFTASAVTAMHLAVAGALGARPGRVVCSAVEHSAILAAIEGVVGTDDTLVIPVNSHGRVNAAAFAAALDEPGVTLACLQAANHEVGTRQPLPAVSKACRAREIPLLVDATMTVGRETIKKTDLTAGDLIVAHAISWGGPAGVGVLGVRSGVPWRPPLALDQREGQRVPGLPATALIAVAARALEWTMSRVAQDSANAQSLIHQLHDAVTQRVRGVTWLGDLTDSVPYLGAFSCLYTDAESLLGGLDAAGFAVSSGSSCVADTRRPSHVLTAMGAASGGNIRITLPIGDTVPDIEGFVDALDATVRDIRERFDAADLPGL